MRAAALKFPERPEPIMRILVVEDEAVLREALRVDLTAAGHTVDVAADGEEGLYAGTEYPIDVAIIDLGLPKLSGLDLIRQLRARGKSFMWPSRSMSPKCRRDWRRCCAGLVVGPAPAWPAAR